MLPAMFRLIWPSGFRGGDLKTNGHSETRIVCGGPCLVMDHNKMCTLQRGPSIDASYQVSVHLADGFQRRRLKCEKLTDDRQQTTDAKSPIAFGTVS